MGRARRHLAAKETLIIADGFSCRSQIEHATDRRALHLAEALQMALHDERSRRSYPERDHVEVRQRAPSNLEVALAASVAFLAVRGVARAVQRI